MKEGKLKYHRILLKLSGEALLGKQSFGICLDAIKEVVLSIQSIRKLGVEVGLVIGGGNIFRGETLTKTGLNRITCDHMGMIATVINGLALRDEFLARDIPVTLMSAVPMEGIVEAYDRFKAITYLMQKKVVIFSGGTGCPLFSTDSAASLRGIEIEADILLKATKVDGVYSADPQIDASAKRFKKLTYQEVLDRNLGVMDLSAICLCREHHFPIRVFNMNKKNALKEIILGKEVGTLVS